jgi:predicted double-glycine peptidase
MAGRQRFEVERQTRVRLSLGVAGVGMVLALLAGESPAAAEVRLSRAEIDADARVQVMSWWEIPFRSVLRQQHDFSCGSAALATLLTYHYQRPLTEREAFVAMWKVGDREAIRNVGFSLLDMKAYLESLGYRTVGLRLRSEQLARLKRPVIALINMNGFKHFVVVKGVRDGRVLLGDPMLGLTEYAFADFEKLWNGIALAIVLDPPGVVPTYNIASDWGPWSQAPMEVGSGGLRIAVGDVTNYLPPIYQITPQITIPVRVGTVP